MNCEGSYLFKGFLHNFGPSLDELCLRYCLYKNKKHVFLNGCSCKRYLIIAGVQNKDSKYLNSSEYLPVKLAYEIMFLKMKEKKSPYLIYIIFSLSNHILLQKQSLFNEILVELAFFVKYLKDLLI